MREEIYIFPAIDAYEETMYWFDKYFLFPLWKRLLNSRAKLVSRNQFEM